MNSEFLYHVFEQTEKNDFSDLMLGVAAARVHTPITDEEDKTVREFISRHYNALVATYASHDREAFAAKVAKCEAEDAAAQAEQAGEDQA